MHLQAAVWLMSSLQPHDLNQFETSTFVRRAASCLSTSFSHDRPNGGVARIPLRQVNRSTTHDFVSCCTWTVLTHCSNPHKRLQPSMVCARLVDSSLSQSCAGGSIPPWARHQLVILRRQVEEQRQPEPVEVLRQEVARVRADAQDREVRPYHRPHQPEVVSILWHAFLSTALVTLLVWRR